MSSFRIIVDPWNPGLIPPQYKDADGCFSLDLKDDEDFGISKQCCDDSPCPTASYVLRFDRSSTYNVPDTCKNRLILDNPFDPAKINSTAFNRGYSKATIISGGNPFSGRLVVSKGTGKGLNKTGYEIKVLSNDRDWVDQAKACCIKDLPLGTYTYDEPQVTEISQTPDICYPDSNIYYPATFSGNLVSGQLNNWSVEDFRPVPYLKFIIDKFFEKIGYRLKSEFMDKKEFRKLGADLVECFGYEEDEVSNAGAYIGLEFSQNIPAGTNSNINFNLETGDFSDPSGNFTTPSFVVPFDMLICIDVCLTVSTLGIPIPPDVGILRISVGGNVVATVSQSQVGQVKYTATANDIPAQAGDSITITFQAPSGNAVQVVPSQTDLNSVFSFVRFRPKTFLPRGIEITLSDYIDKRYKVWPMIEDVIKMFHLRVDVDPVRKVICMEPENDYTLWPDSEGMEPDKCKGFYKSITGAPDWTKRLANCSPSGCDTSNQQEYFSYKYLVDNGDKYVNNELVANASQFVGLYNERYDFKEILPGGSLIGECSTSLSFFAATKNIGTGSWVSVPSVSQSEILGGGSIIGFYEADPPIRSLKHAPRIYYMQGWYQNSPSTNFNYEGTDYDHYPAAWMVNPFVDNLPNLAFDSVEGKRKGLFEIFHKQSVLMRNLNGITEYMFDLSCEDIANFDCRQKICIDGHYYIPVKIENWLANDPSLPTPVKLILAKTKYNII